MQAPEKKAVKVPALSSQFSEKKPHPSGIGSTPASWLKLGLTRPFLLLCVPFFNYIYITLCNCIIASSNRQELKLRKSEEKLDSIINSLPYDVAIKIASLLQVRDLCALSCCSRFWRELCFSDCIWESLARKRWPLLTSFDFPASSSSSSSSASTTSNSPTFKKWRKLYLKRHMELGIRARSVEKFVEACSRSESLEVRDYLNAVETLTATRFGFEDVQRFLFNTKVNVLLNLVGVHYCLTCLGIRGDNLVEALRACEISDRHVCVKWWKVGRWIYGFRRRDESHSRWVSLAYLATEDDGHVLGVLRRGTIHEVLRVQISAVGHTSTPWSYKADQL